ncbi:hypothetical protein B0H14DRAFT_1681863 [Mycena olivaceomarginata]|nr:hypothetical protein B0H14DRAFT_1681863 [Mycena olivaceomarginata]
MITKEKLQEASKFSHHQSHKTTFPLVIPSSTAGTTATPKVARITRIICTANERKKWSSLAWDDLGRGIEAGLIQKSVSPKVEDCEGTDSTAEVCTNTFDRMDQDLRQPAYSRSSVWKGKLREELEIQQVVQQSKRRELLKRQGGDQSDSIGWESARLRCSRPS